MEPKLGKIEINVSGDPENVSLHVRIKGIPTASLSKFLRDVADKHDAGSLDVVPSN